MEAERDLNQIVLRGAVEACPAFSHTSHQESFYLFPLAVERLSGNRDVLNIQLPGKLLAQTRFQPGEEVEVRGSLRTFNNRSGVGPRLVITVLAEDLTPNAEPHTNQLTLRGTICRLGEVRRTPLGREICDFTLAVNRRYGRSDYLPCIAWGSLAQPRWGWAAALRWRAGSKAGATPSNTPTTARSGWPMSAPPWPWSPNRPRARLCPCFE